MKIKLRNAISGQTELFVVVRRNDSWSCGQCERDNTPRNFYSITRYSQAEIIGNKFWNVLFCANCGKIVGGSGFDSSIDFEAYLKRNRYSIKSFYNKHKDKMEVAE